MTTHPTPSPHDAIAKVREALEYLDSYMEGIDEALPSLLPTWKVRRPDDISKEVYQNALAALASLESALATAASAHRAGQEAMRERAAKTIEQRRGENSHKARLIRALPLTDIAPGAEAGEHSPRITDKTEDWDFNQPRVIVQEDGRFVAKDKAMANLPEQDLTLTTRDAALLEENARLGRELTRVQIRAERAESSTRIREQLAERDALRARVEEMEKAAGPFVTYIEKIDDHKTSILDVKYVRVPTWPEFRALRAAIDAGKGEPTR